MLVKPFPLVVTNQTRQQSAVEHAVNVLRTKVALLDVGSLGNTSKDSIKFIEKSLDGSHGLFLFQQLTDKQSDIDHDALADFFGREVAALHPRFDYAGFIAHADPVGKLGPRHDWRCANEVFWSETFHIHTLCSTMFSNGCQAALVLYTIHA